jgi:hypothetical protein
LNIQSYQIPDHFGFNENKLVIYTKNMMPMHGGLIKFRLSCLC